MGFAYETGCVTECDSVYGSDSECDSECGMEYGMECD